MSDRALLVTKTPTPKASFLPAPSPHPQSRFVGNTVLRTRVYCRNLTYSIIVAINSHSTAFQALGLRGRLAALVERRRAMTFAFHFECVKTMVQR